MQLIEQRQQANITPHAGGHLVQYGEKTYYLTELQFTINTPAAHAMRRLIDIQFALPLAVVWFLLCWEILSHG